MRIALFITCLADALGRRSGRIATLPPPLSGWTASRDLPRPPTETFREWWASERGEGAGR